jgi:hypothetical protein
MSAQQGAPRQASSPRVMDAASAVFELSNSLGILRSVQQQDSIITLEHRGKGTLTLGTRRYDVPEYRMSVNYAVPGMRVDFTRASAGAAPERSIHVVSGASAWNESSPGIGAVAEPSALKARLVALWTTPMGVAKAAVPRARVRASLRVSRARTISSSRCRRPWMTSRSRPRSARTPVSWRRRIPMRSRGSSARTS